VFIIIYYVFGKSLNDRAEQVFLPGAQLTVFKMYPIYLRPNLPSPRSSNGHTQSRASPDDLRGEGRSKMSGHNA